MCGKESEGDWRHNVIKKETNYKSFDGDAEDSSAVTGDEWDGVCVFVCMSVC